VRAGEPEDAWDRASLSSLPFFFVFAILCFTHYILPSLGNPTCTAHNSKRDGTRRDRATTRSGRGLVRAFGSCQCASWPYLIPRSAGGVEARPHT